jgi:hypothetical protein
MALRWVFAGLLVLAAATVVFIERIAPSLSSTLPSRMIHTRSVFRRLAPIAIVLALVPACTMKDDPPAVPTTTAASTSARPPSARAQFSPRNAQIVGSIKAVEPPADDIRLFQPIILDAYRVACREVLDVESQIRYTKSKMFVVVSCDGHPTRAVRVVYTGATVPNLIGSEDHALATLGAMLDLHITESSRPARSGDTTNTIVTQHPDAGVVVPFGTTMRVIVAD